MSSELTETEASEVVEEDMPITEEGINIYKTGLFAGRQAAFEAAIEFWENRASLEFQPNDDDQVMFPSSIDTIIDTAARIEHYFYYGRDL